MLLCSLVLNFNTLFLYHPLYAKCTPKIVAFLLMNALLKHFLCFFTWFLSHPDYIWNDCEVFVSKLVKKNNKKTFYLLLTFMFSTCNEIFTEYIKKNSWINKSSNQKQKHKLNPWNSSRGLCFTYSHHVSNANNKKHSKWIEFNFEFVWSLELQSWFLIF